MTEQMLLPHHRAIIEASGISPEVATSRGYRSVTVRAELERLGFSQAQRIVPALLVPIHDVHGQIASYQIRPDHPRVGGRGRVVKYETPKGSRMIVDVPPLARPWLGDPGRPLFITEGARKADSAVSRGLCCVALLGVWNWRGTNDQGGVTALADWESIALADRDVYIVFDSDVAVKQQVEMAMHRLKRFLEKQGASVHVVHLQPATDGSKVGLDDFFARGGTTPELLALTSQAAGRSGMPEYAGDDATAPYVIDRGCFCLEKQTTNGAVLVPLCNFTANVEEELILNDGETTQRAFLVAGTLQSNEPLPKVRVPVDRFAAMHWVPSDWGLRAVIGAGSTTRDRVREAIQRFSPRATKRLVYTHTGWCRVGGQWLYLTADGAVGDGSAEVDLPEDLRCYRIPLVAENPKEAMRRSLALLKVAALEVMAPLWTAAFLAPLATLVRIDLSIWIEGFTGSMKSTLAALVLGHYGGFTRKTLPGDWASTANHLEHRAFVLKDTLFVIDEYTPNPFNRKELEAKAARLVRAQGNLSGRGRMKADLSEHRTFRPRGLVVATGEERPTGQSILARTFLIEMERRLVDVPRLTEAQDNANVLPHAMSGYLHWLAPQMDTLPAQLRATFDDLRSRATIEGTHLRVPELVAHLALGLDCGLAYAQEIGACDAVEADELRMACWESLMARAKINASVIDSNRPTRLFLEVMQTLLDQNRISVLSKAYPSENRRDTTFVGWEDDESYYLIPSAVYQAVAKFCRDAGEPFPVGQNRLQQDLRREHLSQTETNRTTNTVWIGGVSRRVLSLRKAAVSTLLGEAGPASPVLTGLTGNKEVEADGI